MSPHKDETSKEFKRSQTWESRRQDPAFSGYDELRKSKIAAGLSADDALQVTLAQWAEDKDQAIAQANG